MVSTEEALVFLACLGIVIRDRSDARSGGGGGLRRGRHLQHAGKPDHHREDTEQLVKVVSSHTRSFLLSELGLARQISAPDITTVLLQMCNEFTFACQYDSKHRVGTV